MGNGLSSALDPTQGKGVSCYYRWFLYCYRVLKTISGHISPWWVHDTSVAVPLPPDFRLHCGTARNLLIWSWRFVIKISCGSIWINIRCSYLALHIILDYTSRLLAFPHLCPNGLLHPLIIPDSISLPWSSTSSAEVRWFQKQRDTALSHHFPQYRRFSDIILHTPIQTSSTVRKAQKEKASILASYTTTDCNDSCCWDNLDHQQYYCWVCVGSNLFSRRFQHVDVSGVCMSWC